MFYEMKNKRLFITGFIILFFCGCASFDPSMFKQKPSATLEHTDIESISLQDITFVFDVKINNPYPLGITLDRVTSKFTIEGKQVFDTSTKGRFRIKAKGTAINSVSVTLKYMDIINIVKDYSRKDNLNCVISGEIVLAIPVTGIPGIPDSYSFPYEAKMKIPAIKPSISIKNFTIKKPSKTEVLKAIKESGKNLNFLDVIKVVDRLLAGNYADAFKVIRPEDLDLKFDVNFNIELKNDTKTKIKFKHFKYDFILNTDKLIAGDTTDIRTISNKTILTIRNRISLMTFSQSIVRALKENAGDFHLQGETVIKLPDSIKKDPVKLLFNEKGALKISSR